MLPPGLYNLLSISPCYLQDSQGSVQGSRQKALYKYIQLAFSIWRVPERKVVVGRIWAIVLVSTAKDTDKALMKKIVLFKLK